MAFDKSFFRHTYVSEEDSLLRDFYLPALKESVRYDRAVGFFSAAMLTYAFQGVLRFAENRGKMRLVVGAVVSSEEYAAIKSGMESRILHEDIESAITEIYSVSLPDPYKGKLQLLSWMVRQRFLDIQMAVREKGMYHEKIGIMTDLDGDQLVFQGSANETVKALNPDFNFESISVYPSWETEIFDAYGKRPIERFERLWEGQLTNTITLKLPSELYDKIKSYRVSGDIPDYSEFYSEVIGELDVKYSAAPALPTRIGSEKYALRKHQKGALNEWKSRNFRGIFQHATGAGKNHRSSTRSRKDCA